jgi:hypothetical protein
MMTLTPSHFTSNAISWTSNLAFEEMAKKTYFWIGFKNATDVIESYKIKHRGIDIAGAQSNKAQIESFLYNVMKPNTEKQNKRNTNSLWEEVHKHNPSM